MPKVILPERDELVNQLTDMLMVLNQRPRRMARHNIGPARAWIPKAQLEERARNIAAVLILSPSA